jgi:hypothetical protein
MRLDVPYRRVADADADGLEATVAKLAHLFQPEGAPLWQVIAERSRFIGEAGRPADVGYRKMRPTGYAQLCVVNDEVPSSPWALPIGDDVLARSEQTLLVSRWQDVCERLYGPGIIHFLVFAVLAPGGHVPRHRDMPHDSNKKAWSHHLHVPITGAAQAEFELHDERVLFERGGVYEIDNMSWHSATNRGDAFRVNLMIDYCPLADLAARETRSTSSEVEPRRE